ncbi:hypothetical protein CEXT_8191, partial [Caerostris extrusa]
MRKLNQYDNAFKTSLLTTFHVVKFAFRKQFLIKKKRNCPGTGNAVVKLKGTYKQVQPSHNRC